jgi:hypothetical protein
MRTTHTLYSTTRRGRLFGILGVAVAACATLQVTVGAQPSAANEEPRKRAEDVVIGGSCSKGQRGTDPSGRGARCITGPFGSIWAWTAPIPRPVVDPVVPASWNTITAEVSGWNGTGVGLSPLYVDRRAMETAYLALVNRWRTERGLQALAFDPRLAQLSKYWAERFDAPSFRNPNGSSHCPMTICLPRVVELGYVGFGEVVRPWTPIPAGTVDAERYFIDSPSHFAILTSPKYTHVGFAFHVLTGSAGEPTGMVVVGQVGTSR